MTFVSRSDQTLACTTQIVTRTQILHFCVVRKSTQAKNLVRAEMSDLDVSAGSAGVATCTLV